MKVDKEAIKFIKEKAVPVLKKAGVKKSAIFGSYASGEQKKKSDVDILVELSKEMGLLDFVGLKQDLEEVLGKKVDLVEYSAVKPRLRSYILDGEQIQIL